jgi:transcriptional regulator with XRE-family HTH domain
MSYEIQRYETLDMLVEAFAARSRTVLKTMLEYAWDLGAQVRIVREETPYGEGGSKEMAERMGVSESTLGNYAAFNKTFPDRDKAVKTLTEAGISAKTAYSFTAIPDDEKPAVMARMLASDDPAKTLAEEKARIKNEATDKQLITDNTSITETNMEQEASSEDVKYARAAKLPLYRVAALSKQVSEAAQKAERSIGNIDQVANDDLYESVLDVAKMTKAQLDEMTTMLDIMLARIKGYIPEE